MEILITVLGLKDGRQSNTLNRVRVLTDRSLFPFKFAAHSQRCCSPTKRVRVFCMKEKSVSAVKPLTSTHFGKWTLFGVDAFGKERQRRKEGRKAGALCGTYWTGSLGNWKLQPSTFCFKYCTESKVGEERGVRAAFSFVGPVSHSFLSGDILLGCFPNGPLCLSRAWRTGLVWWENG